MLLLARPLAVRAAALGSPVCSLSEQIGATGLERAISLAISHEWPHKLSIDSFLERNGLHGVCASPGRRAVLIDVRAPCEYAKGHIPGATSIPLFSDEERATVGTLYKREGHDVAVRRGLRLVRDKWPALLDEMPDVASEDLDVYVYCFRGGMRSGGMAWLLSEAMPGRVHTLEGGYKRFRNWAIDQWQQPRPLVVLGGQTGSGKTDVLLALRKQLGQQA